MEIAFFESQVLPLKNKLFRYALRLLDNEEEAKDIVQEVLIRVWRHRAEADVQNWEAWSMRIARNLALDRRRVQQRRRTRKLEENDDMQDRTDTPQEATERSEQMEQINGCIQALPEKQRQIIHLRDIEGYSYLEICDLMEMEMNQVKVTLFRARAALRDKLVKMNAYGN